MKLNLGKYNVEIKELSYKTNPKEQDYKKFVESVEQLKTADFSSNAERTIIDQFFDQKHFEKLNKRVEKNTLFLSTPSEKNRLPQYYGQHLADKFNTTHLDLNRYISLEKNSKPSEMYNKGSQVKDSFSYEFKNTKALFELKELTKNKDVILVDDVLTTGEKPAHLATFLKERAGIDINNVDALVAKNQSKTKDQDIQRFSKKMAGFIGRDVSEKNLLSEGFKHFAPYTRLKLEGFEKGVKDEISATRALNVMKINNEKIHKSLEKSISREIPKVKDWDRDHNKDHDLDL